MKLATTILTATLVCSFLALGANSASAQQSSDVGRPTTPRSIELSPSFETDVDNGDGTWTFTQAISSASTPPHYTGPFFSAASCETVAGFGYYSWFDQDYGWQHNFPHWAGANILSATMTIVAWDVDSETFHGTEGEYDGIHVDGTLLDPGYLQGTTDTWSVTEFNTPVGSILDDGLVNVFMNIDMNHSFCNWATTLDNSTLKIVYAPDSTSTPNDHPFAPQLAAWPLGCPPVGDSLFVSVVGPTPRDPDGDAVTYNYRWFVDVGTGSFIDDEFAGRGDHTGNVVPAGDPQAGDLWRVQVTPVDEHGAIGPFTTYTWGPVGGPTPAQRQSWGAMKALYR